MTHPVAFRLCFVTAFAFVTGLILAVIFADYVDAFCMWAVVNHPVFVAGALFATGWYILKWVIKNNR